MSATSLPALKDFGRLLEALGAPPLPEERTHETLVAHRTAVAAHWSEKLTVFLRARKQWTHLWLEFDRLCAPALSLDEGARLKEVKRRAAFGERVDKLATSMTAAEELMLSARAADELARLLPEAFFGKPEKQATGVRFLLRNLQVVQAYRPAVLSLLTKE